MNCFNYYAIYTGVIHGADRGQTDTLFHPGCVLTKEDLATDCEYRSAGRDVSAGVRNAAMMSPELRSLYISIHHHHPSPSPRGWVCKDMKPINLGNSQLPSRAPGFPEVIKDALLLQRCVCHRHICHLFVNLQRYRPTDRPKWGGMSSELNARQKKEAAKRHGPPLHGRVYYQPFHSRGAKRPTRLMRHVFADRRRKN